MAIAATVGLVAADKILWNAHGVAAALHEKRTEVYSTLATIFGALLGFVVTAYSIVVSLNESEVLRRLRERGTASDILSVFTKSVYVIGLATIVGLSAIFLDSDNSSDNRWLEYIVFLMSVWASLAVLAVVFLIDALLNAVNTVADEKARSERSPRPAP